MRVKNAVNPTKERTEKFGRGESRYFDEIEGNKNFLWDARKPH